MGFVRVPRRFVSASIHAAMFGALAFAVVVLATHRCSAQGSAVQQPVYASGRIEAAQDLAQRSLECLHRGEDALTKEGRLTAYREGFELAKRAVQADDRNADAHFACFANGGRVMLLEGKVANPVNLWTVNRELDRVLDLNPNHVDALAARGGMYRQLPWVLGGSLEKAADYLGRAVQLDPNNAVGARIELAETYRDMGHPERSVPLLETAMQVARRMGKLRQLQEARQLLTELRTGDGK
ncbi:MAG: tetratricopeptide repeat protein [Candidatus Binatia bacterium]